MPANSTVQPALDDAVSAAAPSRAKLEDALADFRERATQVAQETIEAIRTQAKPYIGDAGQKLSEAEKYLVDRVQKQPLTTTLAALGVGVLVGLVLAGGRNR
jgi:ElaB/YqjD/DUF883 family membrane-anchored ribosome-binding protein